MMLGLIKSAQAGGVDPFVSQLASLSTAHRIRAKWVFVPTHALGRTLGERIVLEGTSWLNLRFVTPLDIALRMGGPFLVERGVHPSEEGLGPALMMRLLLDLPLEGSYFRPLADHPTMAQALWTTVRELRMYFTEDEDSPIPGSDTGGERAAAMYSLIGSAKLNGLDPEAYLREVLSRIADHPITRIEELLPWNIAVSVAAASQPAA
jgi:hypothetical protein